MNEDEKTPKDDSSREQEPRIYALTRDATGYRLDRRDFLKAAGLAAAAVAASGSATARIAEAATNHPRRPSGVKMQVVDGNLDRLPRAHRQSVSSLSSSADGKLLASGSADRKIKLWELPEGKLTSSLFAPQADVTTGGVVTAFLSSDGKLLASGGTAGKGGASMYWSLPENKAIQELGKIGSFAGAMSADGKILAGTDLNWLKKYRDNAIALWSLPDGKKLAAVDGVDSTSLNGLTASLSADGKTLACVSNSDRTAIKLWTVPPAKKEFKILTGHKRALRALCLSPDGKLLASADEVHIIKLWSLPEGVELAAMECDASVHALSFSGDGKLLASGHMENNSVRLWEAPTGNLLETFNTGDTVKSVALSGDAKFLFAGTLKGRIFLWELDGKKRAWVLFDIETEENQTKVSCYDDQESVMAGAVCTCDLVCTCNTVWAPAGASLPNDATCVCNTIMMGKSKPGGAARSESTSTVVKDVCVCDTVCTCYTISTPVNAAPRPQSGGGTRPQSGGARPKSGGSRPKSGGTYRGGGHYWRPS